MKSRHDAPFWGEGKDVAIKKHLGDRVYTLVSINIRWIIRDQVEWAVMGGPVEHQMREDA